ncbi:MAG: hypothetical protein IT508_11560, partial [Burkholderiaceae bacterium]|nr:hypothetical protein [Burkholderiaceae bacterium]
MAARLLLLTHRLPFPPDRGDRIRAYHLLRELAQSHEVSLACTDDEPLTSDRLDAIKPWTRRLAACPRPRFVGPIHAAAHWLVSSPATPAMFYRPDLARTILRWHREAPFDTIVTYCTGMLEYSRELLAHSRAPIRHILDLVDVDSLKWHAYARTAKPPQSWLYDRESLLLRRAEAGLFCPFDAVTVVSQAEANAYEHHVL